ncbi:MAG: PQQ-binding-like beta-propeller repeat protein [Bacteroidetes bacterium]|jgi:outer membrane protein assembly factor BamB|nr:PQQ-binding-like beta-propeller repeat protein [Bacteroidota bacterium]
MLLSVVVLAGLFGCSHEVVRTETKAQLHLSETTLGEAGLAYYWYAHQQVPLAPGETIQRLVLLDDNLYVMTDQAALIAVDAAVGKQRWRVTVSLAGRKVYTPSHVDNMPLREEVWTDTVAKAPEAEQFPRINAVAVNDLAHMLLIERESGKIYRDIKFDRTSATNAGVCDEERFYYPGLDNMCNCYNLMLGQVIWWQSYTGLAEVPLRTYAGRVYVGTSDGRMQCMTGGSVGIRKWTLTFDRPILAPFHVGPRGLFFAVGNQVRAHDAISGLKLWEPVYVDGVIEDGMQLSGTTLYQHARGDGLYAINLTNGEVRWHRPGGWMVLAVMDGQAYVLDTDANLHVMNEITGEVTASVPMARFDFFVPNTQSPAIYAATRSGQIYCIRKSDAGRLTAEMLQQD